MHHAFLCQCQYLFFILVSISMHGSAEKYVRGSLTSQLQWIQTIKRTVNLHLMNNEIRARYWCLCRFGWYCEAFTNFMKSWQVGSLLKEVRAYWIFIHITIEEMQLKVIYEGKHGETITCKLLKQVYCRFFSCALLFFTLLLLFHTAQVHSVFICGLHIVYIFENVFKRSPDSSLCYILLSFIPKTHQSQAQC